VRLAFYTYSYTDRLKMSIPECLERIARTGYTGIDVSGTNGNSADPRSFDAARRKLTRESAEKHGLKIEAVITHQQLTDAAADPKRNPLDLIGSVDLAADLGAPVVTFHMGGYHEGTPRKVEWQQAVTAIRQAAEHGAGKHVSVAVDGIWPAWINDSPDEMQRLFDDVDHPSFGVNFDPSYLTLIHVDPVTFAKRFSEEIVHAHLKDHKKGKYAPDEFPKWTEVMPGRGEMDYSRVFRALAQNGFQGAVAVECFTNMEFVEACESCHQAMSQAARKASVRFND
jgi:sugar phosphate isomerase/epimerase